MSGLISEVFYAPPRAVREVLAVIAVCLLTFGLLHSQSKSTIIKAGTLIDTDGGVYPHGFNGRQFRFMVEWGMAPMQAIQSAT